MRRRERAFEWLERRTCAIRSRYAGDVFLRGRPRQFDRLVSGLYFALAAGRWAAYEDVDHHLAALRAGLERCRPPTAALDIGTGTGGAASEVARRHPGAAVVGVDSSRSMLRLARRRHPGPRLRFERASSLRLPFPDAAFDLVTCLNAVPEPVELRRVTTADSEVLLAATTQPLRDEASSWVQRWKELGFRRAAGADVDGGSWELYERDGSGSGSGSGSGLGRPPPDGSLGR